jgi:cyclophilin family peptidyl-prolyl cis-trans isomerase
VNLVFRHFPLISIHPKAMPAARAAEAAGAQGKFFEMHDLLFENQAVWSAETMSLEQFDTWLRDQAESLGLDMEKFDEVYTSAETQAKLDAEYKNVTENIGLTGTPSVFITINGIPYMGPRDYEGLAGILRLIDLDKNRYNECPPMTIDPDKTYTATITTTKGDVVVELFAEKAPMTVNSFVFLAQDGYFDNVAWHRVMPGFVAQAGDPSGSGFGGPGYEFSNEISELTFDAEGVLGMANAGADTNGSQFFITYAAQPSLDGGYTVFGKVIEGMDVVKALNPVDPQQGGKLADSDLILDVQISEK